MYPDHTDPAPSSRARGCGTFFALWIGSAVSAAILIALVGPQGLAWDVGASVSIAAVFVMVFGSIRVLRGHDL